MKIYLVSLGYELRKLGDMRRCQRQGSRRFGDSLPCSKLVINPFYGKHEHC